ncbi:YgjP-like metallopeptidase domain-containing protein [Leptospira kobayashii]
MIVHELCHMVSPKHDETFFRILRRILPDWEKRKTKLEKTLFSL